MHNNSNPNSRNIPGSDSGLGGGKGGSGNTNTENNGLTDFGPEQNNPPMQPPDYGQPIDSARIVNNKLRIVFEYANAFTDFYIYIFPDVEYGDTFSLNNNLTTLNTNIYLFTTNYSE